MKHLVGMLAAAAFMMFGLTSAQALTFGSPPVVTPGGPPSVMGPNSLTGVAGFSVLPSQGVTDNYGIVANSSGNLTVALQNNAASGFPGASTEFFDVVLKDTTLNTNIGHIVLGFVTSFSTVFSGIINTHTYQLIVSYNTGSGGAVYGGSLFLSAVPLPASLPLLAAALGILGLLVYFRRQSASA